jgi:hypothetical protein
LTGRLFNCGWLGGVTATSDCPQNEEQKDRADECDDGGSDQAAEADMEHTGDEAADKGTQDADDQVTEDAAGTFARDDRFGKETGDNADDDP